MPVYEPKRVRSTGRNVAYRAPDRTAGFGLLATLSLPVGLYGVMAFVVARRTRLHGPFVSAQLYGIKVNDPGIAIASILMLIFMASLAGFIPAQCASRIDPILALRYE